MAADGPGKTTCAIVSARFPRTPGEPSGHCGCACRPAPHHPWLGATPRTRPVRRPLARVIQPGSRPKPLIERSPLEARWQPGHLVAGFRVVPAETAWSSRSAFQRAGNLLSESVRDSKGLAPPAVGFQKHNVLEGLPHNCFAASAHRKGELKFCGHAQGTRWSNPRHRAADCKAVS
jgi:hypothetical protein